MSCRPRRSSQPSALDVKDCSTCERSEFVTLPEGPTLACYLGPSSVGELDGVLSFRASIKTDADGFPVGNNANCPAWKPAWSE